MNKIEQIRKSVERIKMECECILQDLETFEETREYDEIFTMESALKRIAVVADATETSVAELEEECSET